MHGDVWFRGVETITIWEDVWGCVERIVWDEFCPWVNLDQIVLSPLTIGLDCHCGDGKIRYKG